MTGDRDLIESADPVEEQSVDEDVSSTLESPADESSDLERVSVERDDYLDALKRLQAEFENYRKRTIRQQTELLERASQSLVERLLPVLDALDLAIAHADSAVEEKDETAFAQIGALLRDVLTREGLDRIDEVGVPFDPTIHDAVAHVARDEEDSATTDEEDETPSQSHVVKEVLRAGYRLKGRVLRPAMVKVEG